LIEITCHNYVKTTHKFIMNLFTSIMNKQSWSWFFIELFLFSSKSDFSLFMPLFNGIANATCIIVPLMLKLPFLYMIISYFLVLKDKDLKIILCNMITCIVLPNVNFVLQEPLLLSSCLDAYFIIISNMVCSIVVFVVRGL